MRARRGIFGVLTLSLVTACGPDSSVGTTERYLLGDTVVVFSFEPVYPDTIRAREVMRFGRLSGDPDLLFNEIRTFMAANDGGLIIHDRGEGIRRYDREGNFIGRVAGVGAGPAEVRSVLAMAENGSGLIAAYDLGNNRVTLLDGVDVRSVSRPDGMPRYGGDGLFFTEDGELWAGLTPPFPSEGGVSHPRPIYARLSVDGTWTDTTFTPDRFVAECPELTRRANVSGFWEDAREPFLPKVKWGVGPDRSILVGCPARYEFEVLDRDGSVYRIGRQWEALQLPNEQQDFLANQLRLPGLPPERPAYTRLVSMSEGRIWVRPTLPSERIPLPEEAVRELGITHMWDESTRAVFDVFTLEDGWLGTVALPDEARYNGFPTEPRIVIRGDSIWAVATDSMDVEYVVKYVVDWSGQ